MALRDILFVLGSDTGNAAIEAGVGLAARHDARLTGLFVQPPPLWMFAETTAEMVDAQRSWLQERTEATAARFRRCVEQAGAGSRAVWQVRAGDPADIAATAAHSADLCVAMQPRDASWGEVTPARPDELLFGSGRPVLMIPHAGQFPSLGNRVLVAWNGSPEVARAVHDALPLMSPGARVDVLTVARRDGAEERSPGADIALHLGRHGFEASAHRLVSADVQPIDLILDFAADRGADLLVMGGYGHSRLRERILGGVTAGMLATATLPVLMSH
ncbi:universal stress protein [Arenibaculum pallidiluteum]|uniref:universal stress protein n=1 Tax=Arenibaculum pallidiluteum TaxID=2812559 RepID=UPI001A969D14|nr:universal stress protein [Arenibaculum pallidiluteum]